MNHFTKFRVIEISEADKSVTLYPVFGDVPEGRPVFYWTAPGQFLLIDVEVKNYKVGQEFNIDLTPVK